MKLTDTHIGFIGAGNMAGALIEGLLATGHSAAMLHAADPDEAKLAHLAQKGVTITTNNLALIASCDVVLLAVKPQVLPQVLQPLKAAFESSQCLLISVAAGILIDQMTSLTHARQAIVRCMPNTPALVGAGASGLFANVHVSDEQRTLAGAIMEAVGIVRWLNSEAQIDAVTALSGSGPAYFFLLMEAMQQAGENLGLDKDTAKALCMQTAFGAAKLAQSSDVELAELRRRVTSPGGTTEAAIKQFEQEHLRDIVERALGKAAARSVELSRSQA